MLESGSYRAGSHAPISAGRKRWSWGFRAAWGWAAQLPLLVLQRGLTEMVARGSIRVRVL